MADETTIDDHADEAHHFDPPIGDPPEAMTASERLRALEDEHFGEKCVRIRDQIERGSGSPYALAAPEVRAQHEALTKLITAEAKLSAANAAVAVAQNEYDAALAATEPKPDADHRE